MEIRKASRSDIRRVAELWVHSFPGERSVAERMHALETGGSASGIDVVWLAEDADGLAGASKLLPMVQYFAGSAVPMLGLAAVAVAPHARRRGVARRICEHALRTAHAEGRPVSVLYPFRPEFYARYGWALTGQLHRYTFRPETLMAPDAGAVRLARESDETAIRACYERVALQSNGMIQRGPRAWKQHLDAPGAYAWVLDDGGVRGYLIARYGKSRSTERRPLHVRELVAEDEAAYRSLLGWIPRQRDLWRRVSYDALPDEHFDMRLEDPRPPGHVNTRWLWSPTARVLRGPMLRIADVRAAFELRSAWGTETPCSFTLRVEDPQLAENSGDFLVEFTGTATRVTPGATDGPVISLGIGTLALLYTGELRVSEAVRLEKASVEGDVRPVEAFFRARSGFRMLDEF
jgi:predicted acetyltransferase